MKSIILSFVLLILPASLWAGLPKDIADRDRAERTALDFFLAGDGTAGIAHLRANLKPEASADGGTTQLIQSLINISSACYNLRRIGVAQTALRQAMALAEPMRQGKSAVSAARRADLYSSLGRLCENVLFDTNTAAGYYAAAAEIAPANRLNAARLKTIAQQQKLRATRRNP